MKGRSGFNRFISELTPGFPNSSNQADHWSVRAGNRFPLCSGSELFQPANWRINDVDNQSAPLRSHTCFEP